MSPWSRIITRHSSSSLGSTGGSNSGWAIILHCAEAALRAPQEDQQHASRAQRAHAIVVRCGGNGRRRPKPPLHPCRTRPSLTTPSLGAPSLARRPALARRAKPLIWRPRTSRNGAASRAVLSALRRSPESSGHRESQRRGVSSPMRKRERRTNIPVNNVGITRGIERNA